MSSSTKQETSIPKYIVDQTIVFLRPNNQEAIAVLNATENDLYRFEVAPPNNPTNQQLGKIFDEDSTSLDDSEEQLLEKMSVVAPQAHNPSSSVSTEASGINIQRHPFAFRFGFDSVEKPSREGFSFGDTPECNVQLLTPTAQRHFWIHYAFKSGALLVTADMPIWVGQTLLSRSQSLVLMPDTTILCQSNADISFLVEFPDINHCVDLHRENYRQYSMRCGVKRFSYMPTLTGGHVFKNHLCLGILGTGGFGTVQEAVNLSNGRRVALKITWGQPNIMKEVEIMQGLRHDHIITLYSYNMLSSGFLCITMELAVNDLSAHIKAKQNGRLTLHCIRSLARQALSGLSYLHSKNVTHRDLKPSNILVTKWDQITDTLEIKLADFGLSSMDSEPRTNCGTTGYRAPEVEDGEVGEDGKLAYPYTMAVDIWAMGKILLELVANCDMNVGGKGRRSQAIAPALRLITQMMESNPDKRPTAALCLQSEWLEQEEPMSKLVARKRKASHEATNPRAKRPGLGD